MPTASMVFDVIARDGASGAFRRMSGEAQGASASFDRLGKAAAGISVVFAAFAVNAAAKFESAMTRISTQAGVPIQQIKGLGDALLNLAPKVGTGPDALATSLYHVQSAFRTTGISAGKAIDIVKQASELAKIGGADLETTTQAIIGTLASGIKGVKDAADAAAQINQLVGTGDTTLAAVTKSIATGILPTAATLGLSFKDVAAALSTLTDNATPADEAATRLRTTLSLIENPGGKAQAALSSIGLSSTTLAEDFRKPNGLLLAMQDLQTHLNSVYPLTKTTALSTDQIAAATKNYTGQLLAQGVQAKVATDLGNKYAKSLKDGGSAATLQAQTILSAFGGARTGSTFLTLYDELDRLKSKYKDFGTSAQAANKFQEAWANQQGTFKQKLDDLKASWDVFLIKAGNAILPTLKKITDFLSKHPKLLQDAALAVGVLAGAWALFKIGQITTGLYGMAKAILTVGAASTTAAAGSATANVGGAAAAGAATRRGLSPAAKVIVPVAVTYAAASALGLRKSLDDLLTGDFKDFGKDGPGWTKEIGSGIRQSITGSLSGTFIPNAVSNAIKKNAKDLVLVNGVVDDAATAFKTAGDAADGYWKHVVDSKQVSIFQNSLKTARLLLDSNTNSLEGNTAGAVSNRKGLETLAFQAIVAAQAYAKTTGRTSDYTKSLQLAIPQIEAAAVKTGLNKDEVDKLLTKLGLLPPNKAVPVTTPGAADANNAVLTLLGNLNKINGSYTATVNLMAAFNNGSVGTSFAGLFGYTGGNVQPQADGSISMGKPGGIYQWAEAGPEAFIPLSPAKRSKSLSLWAQTGKMLGVPGFADGAIVINERALGFQNAGTGLATALNSAVSSAAQKAAAQFAQSSAGSGSIGGGVQQWIPLVLQVLAMLGQPSSLLTNVLQQMTLESGGNPNAINLWDSNAAIGQPSKGLMQTIDSTFNAYAGPFRGLGIYNPLANIYAGLNYASQTGGIGRLHGTQGYAMGTSSARPGWALVGERGPEWMKMRGGEKVLPSGQTPGPLLHIEHWHGDQTDADGLASQIAAKTRATALARRV